MLRPARPRKVTLRRRGVAVVLLLALVARALVRKSWGGGWWAQTVRGLKEATAVAAAEMVRKWRREIAGDVRVMRFVPCTVGDTWWGGGVKVMNLMTRTSPAI